MKITKDSSLVVPIYVGIEMLSKHQLSILSDNGWVLDEYDDLFKLEDGVYKVPHDVVDKLFKKYIEHLSQKMTTHTNVDIFKIIFVLLTQLERF